MVSSKARKILRRTLMGSTLALLSSLVLWLTANSAHGWPLAFAIMIVLCGATYEVSRMGGLRDRDREPALVFSAMCAICLLGSALRALHAEDQLALLPALATAPPSLLITYASTLLLAATSFGWSFVLRGRLVLSEAAARAILLLGIGGLILYATNDATELALRLRASSAILLILALVTLPLLWRAGRMRDLCVTLALALWLIPPLPGLWSIWRESGNRGLLALLLLSKIGDSAGYYVGNAIGKSHPFPTISPGKTTAGCVGSLVAAMIAGAILVQCNWLPSGRLGVAGGILAGALINLAAQAGDILESWVKRRAGVKDSSKVFGPSGGVLDQIDSLLVTVPVGVLCWPLLFAQD